MEIAGCEPDVIIITEVIPKAQLLPLSLAIFTLDGYRTYLNFDPTIPRLGARGIRGLCIFIKNELQCLPFETSPTVNAESLSLHIPLQGSDSLLLGAVYRSPNSCLRASTTEVCDLMKEISKSSATHILLTGDFNYPEIDWKTTSCLLPQDQPNNMFIDALNDCFFTQRIRQATPYRLGVDPSILDLVLSNEEGMVNNVCCQPGLGSSDHLILTFSIVWYTYCPSSKRTQDKKIYVVQGRLPAASPAGLTDPVGTGRNTGSP